MLEHEILGNPLRVWIIAVAIIAAAVLLTKLLALFGRRIIKPFITRTENDIDNILYDSLATPVRFAVMLLGIWIAIHRLAYPEQWVRYVDYAYRILIILDITWFVALLATGFLERYWGRKAEGTPARMLPVIRRVALIVVWILGILTALSNIGVDLNALWGTLGIGGIAFALAAQNTVKNLFGALSIFTDKPFTLGDTIRVEGIEGTVVDIGLRSTRILGYDRRITTVPNEKITDAAIVNISSEPLRRTIVKVGIAYDTPAPKVEQAIELLRALPQRLAHLSRLPGDTTVYFSDYTETALVLSLFYHIEKEADSLRVTSEVNLAILAAFDAAGIRFAYPRTLRIEPTDDGSSASQE